MAYATLENLLDRFDQRTVAQLASDANAPAADLANNSRIAAALADGAGMINSAVMVAGLYTTEQLTTLTGDDAEFLTRLNCELAMGFLLGRRPEKYGDEGVQKLLDRAEQQLDLLRQGSRIFNIEAVKEAGQPTIDGPTAVTYDRLNMLPDRTNNFYPGRASRLPIGRG